LIELILHWMLQPIINCTLNGIEIDNK